MSQVCIDYLPCRQQAACRGFSHPLARRLVPPLPSPFFSPARGDAVRGPGRLLHDRVERDGHRGILN